MNKPKTLIIRFNEATHEPEYMGIETPTEYDYSIVETLYGDPMSRITPIPNKEEEHK
jgi:hypothetical protein